MTRGLVCDASSLVALLLDGGPEGRWVADTLSGARLLGPSLVLFETSNIIRRHELAGLVSADLAVQAHHDLLDLGIEQWPYRLLAARAWELRKNLSTYDASYVALAELTQTELITLDARIAGAPNLRCPIRVPD